MTPTGRAQADNINSLAWLPAQKQRLPALLRAFALANLNPPSLWLAKSSLPPWLGALIEGAKTEDFRERGSVRELGSEIATCPRRAPAGVRGKQPAFSLPRSRLRSMSLCLLNNNPPISFYRCSLSPPDGSKPPRSPRSRRKRTAILPPGRVPEWLAEGRTRGFVRLWNGRKGWRHMFRMWVRRRRRICAYRYNPSDPSRSIEINRSSHLSYSIDESFPRYLNGRIER